eukprot:TRINITY_DN5439_c0_g1_i5.p1 TRINITY_DN5439_c0_g1~~TRINITY_DN5439_c0_g1_i5.p1  ORF type:complete len:462 (-),score=83.45 TRINITY_DN5439_c0_g1_i5:122-1429(-)
MACIVRYRRRMPYFTIFGAELLLIMCFGALMVAHNDLVEMWGGSCLESAWGGLLSAPCICTPLILCAFRLSQLVDLEKEKSWYGNQRMARSDSLHRIARAKFRASIPFFLGIFALSSVPALAFGVFATTSPQDVKRIDGACVYKHLTLINGLYGVCMFLLLWVASFYLRKKQENFGCLCTFVPTWVNTISGNAGVKRALWKIVLYALPTLLIWVIVRLNTEVVEGSLPLVAGLLIWEVHIVFYPVWRNIRDSRRTVVMPEKVTRRKSTAEAPTNEATFNSDRSLSLSTLDEDGDSLEAMMAIPTFEKYFTLFLTRELSTENLLFWKEAKAYAASPSLSEAKRITSVYVASQAVMEINISASARRRIIATILELTANPNVGKDKLATIFDLALEEIQHILEFDCLRRFRESDEFFEPFSKSLVSSPRPPALAPRPL